MYAYDPLQGPACRNKKDVSIIISVYGVIDYFHFFIELIERVSYKNTEIQGTKRMTCMNRKTQRGCLGINVYCYFQMKVQAQLPPAD